jgi:hypothetical protein
MAHKVFVSYHHSNDQDNQIILEHFMEKVILLLIVHLMKKLTVMMTIIFSHKLKLIILKDSTVTIVLIGVKLLSESGLIGKFIPL